MFVAFLDVLFVRPFCCEPVSPSADLATPVSAGNLVTELPEVEPCICINDLYLTLIPDGP